MSTTILLFGRLVEFAGMPREESVESLRPSALTSAAALDAP
ncbi:hypothetical protein ACTXKZ_03380 [Brachybacterium alimentarium]